MNYIEIKSSIERLRELYESLYFHDNSIQLFNINSDSGLFSQMEALLEFVYSDQSCLFIENNRRYDSYELSLMYGNRSQFDKDELERITEKNKNRLGEIFDILSDLTFVVCKNFSDYVSFNDLQSEEHSLLNEIHNKLHRYKETREHRLDGVFSIFARRIFETVNCVREKVGIKIPSLDIDQIIKQTVDILEKNFSGKNKKGWKIMPDNDYKNLVDSTIELIRRDATLENIIPIQNINLSGKIICAEYRKILDLRYSDERRKLFTIFLSKIYPKLKNPGFSEEHYGNSSIYKYLSPSKEII